MNGSFAPAIIGLLLVVGGFMSAGALAEDDAQRGRELYRELYCGACHQLTSLGASGFFGPPHDAVAVIAAARLRDPGYRGSASSAEEYLRESIVAPAAYIVPGYAATRHHMPAYDLREEELAALVAFLLSLDGSQPLPSGSEGGVSARKHPTASKSMQ